MVGDFAELERLRIPVATHAQALGEEGVVIANGLHTHCTAALRWHFLRRELFVRETK